MYLVPLLFFHLRYEHIYPANDSKNFNIFHDFRLLQNSISHTCVRAFVPKLCFYNLNSTYLLLILNARWIFPHVQGEVIKITPLILFYFISCFLQVGHERNLHWTSPQHCGRLVCFFSAVFLLVGGFLPPYDTRVLFPARSILLSCIRWRTGSCRA
jgi:hypothetical protein